MSIGEVLRQAAQRWPSRTGVLDDAEDSLLASEHTFAELDERARTVSARLMQEGLAPGDRVALIGSNSADFVAAWFGIVYAGCAVAPIPILSAPPELEFRVSHAGCKAVLFDPARSELARSALAAVTPAPRLLDLGELAHASVAPEARQRAFYQSTPSDPAMLLYTSGTTGKPKGALISHGSLRTHTEVLTRHVLQLGEQDCVLGVLPLTHSFGCRMVMLVSAYAGARVVLAARFVASRSLALMAEHGVSWVPVVPTMLAAWGAEPSGPPLPALRWCLSAGAPLADEVARRAEARLGAEVRQGYGMSEATFATVNAPPDARVFGCVGKPVPGIELRIADDAGHELAQGQAGEVLVRGHNVMSGYLNDPAATAEATFDGFLRSGDVGRFDESGRLWIVDRIKDLIIRGGYNVYPSEVEDVLAAHPAVREAAVVGRSDPYYGEEVVAVVALRPGAAATLDELAGFVSVRLSRVKRPREYAFVDAFPLGPSDKVLKRTLRKWLEEGIIAPQRPAEGNR